MALSRPRSTRRALHGAALGLGLVVAAGVTAPAALAIEDTDEGTVDQTLEESEEATPLAEEPSEDDGTLAPALAGDFGTGKDFTVQVQPTDPVPDDLDLSGAVFRATADDDGATYTCTTDVAGACSFDSGWVPSWSWPAPWMIAFTADRTDAVVPTGSYVLTQVGSSPGLDLNTGSATFTVCDTDFCGDFGEDEIGVGNDSLFRQELVTTVTDIDTGAPLACAGYELTGPDYPHDGTGAAQVPAETAVPAGCTDPAAATATSSAPATTTAPATQTTPAPSADATETTGTASTSPTEETTETDESPVDVLDVARDDENAGITYGTQISDETGTLTFRGWFLPAEGYLLTPTSTPDGYSPDVTDTFGIQTTAAQAAAEEPVTVARALYTFASGSTPQTDPSGEVAGAATTSAEVVAGAATTSASAGATASATTASAGALAVTGSPVGTMLLVGTGLVALGGGALATGATQRRRARRSA